MDVDDLVITDLLRESVQKCLMCIGEVRGNGQIAFVRAGMAQSSRVLGEPHMHPSSARQATDARREEKGKTKNHQVYETTRLLLNLPLCIAL